MTGLLRGAIEYDAVRDTDVTFLCLPTPQKEDGSIGLSMMEAGTEQLGEILTEKTAWHTVVVRSIVIPGSTETHLHRSWKPKPEPLRVTSSGWG